MEITAVSTHTTDDGTAYSMTVLFGEGREVAVPLHEMQYGLLKEALQSVQDEVARRKAVQPPFSTPHLEKLVQHFNDKKIAQEDQVFTFQNVDDSEGEPMDLGEQIPLRGGLGGVRQL